MPFIHQIKAKHIKDDCAYLLRHKRDVTSQGGEDGIIEEIFNIIGEKSRWCAEFGAWDGKYLSNTYTLIANRDWSGALIEGNPERFADLCRTYAGNARAHPVAAVVGFDPERDSLDRILGRTPIPVGFDLLSIDIDGNDWHVWESLAAYRPRVVVIEFNPSIPNDVAFVQDRDFGINQGCSLRALIDLAKAKGYELVCATDWNGIFVAAEEFPRFGIADNGIDALYAPVCDGRVFHGYDGTIYTAGMPGMLWREQAIAADALQIVPAEARFYGDRLPDAPPAGLATAPGAAVRAMAAVLAAQGRGDEVFAQYHEAAALTVAAARPGLVVNNFRMRGRTVTLNGCRLPGTPRPGLPLALFFAAPGSDLAAGCLAALPLMDLFDLAVIELPGSGITAPAADSPADELAALFESGQVGQVSFAIAEGPSGLTALRLARGQAGKVGNVVLLDPPLRADLDLLAGAGFGCLVIAGQSGRVDDADIAAIRQTNPKVVVAPRVAGAGQAVLRDQPQVCLDLLRRVLAFS